jgi:hypothetical protein
LIFLIPDFAVRRLWRAAHRKTTGKSGFCTVFGSICTPENRRAGRDDRMSRGLGKLQREIIETLDEAKQHFSDAFCRGGGSLATYRYGWHLANQGWSR